MFVIKTIRGIRITVTMPATAIDRPLMAPWTSPISRALVVPRAWATVPMPTPWATGSVILNTLIIIGAIMMPTIPRIITYST